MDYQIINAKDIDNLNKDDSEVIFDFNPSTNINFFEASLVLNISLKIDFKDMDETQQFNYRNKMEGKNPSFDKFFIYKLFKTIEYKENNESKYSNKRIYDYVRMKNIFNNPKNDIHGFNYIKLDSELSGLYKLQFNIPLKFLFSEFEDLFFYSKNRHTLHVELSDNNVLKSFMFDDEYPLTLKSKSILSLYLKVPIKFTTLNNEIVMIKNQEFRKSQMGELNISSEFQESTISIRGDKSKPISFLFMLKDKDNCIVTSKELANIQLDINNKLYPQYEMKLNYNYNYDYLYEMYCRYIEFYYGNSSNYLVNQSYSYYSFTEFQKHPIICFILPQLEDDNSYEMSLNIKFTNSSKKTKKITYLYSFIDRI